MHIFGKLVHIFGRLVHIFGKLVHIFARKLLPNLSKQVSINLGPLWQPGAHNDTNRLFAIQAIGPDNLAPQTPTVPAVQPSRMLTIASITQLSLMTPNFREKSPFFSRYQCIPPITTYLLACLPPSYYCCWWCCCYYYYYYYYCYSTNYTAICPKTITLKLFWGQLILGAAM